VDGGDGLQIRRVASNILRKHSWRADKGWSSSSGVTKCQKGPWTWTTNGEKRNVHKILVGKLEEKRPLGRPRHRWDDKVRMDLRETGWGGMDWIDLAQDSNKWKARVITEMNLWVP
jgi:hypothetical protein